LRNQAWPTAPPRKGIEFLRRGFVGKVSGPGAGSSGVPGGEGTVALQVMGNRAPKVGGSFTRSKVRDHIKPIRQGRKGGWDAAVQAKWGEEKVSTGGRGHRPGEGFCAGKSWANRPVVPTSRRCAKS